jgi:hypothetical protein
MILILKSQMLIIYLLIHFYKIGTALDIQHTSTPEYFLAGTFTTYAAIDSASKYRAKIFMKLQNVIRFLKTSSLLKT